MELQNDQTNYKEKYIKYKTKYLRYKEKYDEFMQGGDCPGRDGLDNDQFINAGVVNFDNVKIHVIVVNHAFKHVDDVVTKKNCQNEDLVKDLCVNAVARGSNVSIWDRKKITADFFKVPTIDASIIHIYEKVQYIVTGNIYYYDPEIHYDSIPKTHKHKLCVQDKKRDNDGTDRCFRIYSITLAKEDKQRGIYASGYSTQQQGLTYKQHAKKKHADQIAEMKKQKEEENRDIIIHIAAAKSADGMDREHLLQQYMKNPNFLRQWKLEMAMEEKKENAAEVVSDRDKFMGQLEHDNNYNHATANYNNAIQDPEQLKLYFGELNNNNKILFLETHRGISLQDLVANDISRHKLSGKLNILRQRKAREDALKLAEKKKRDEQEAEYNSPHERDRDRDRSPHRDRGRDRDRDRDRDRGRDRGRDRDRDRDRGRDRGRSPHRGRDRG
jgi:hypothetical protein